MSHTPGGAEGGRSESPAREEDVAIEEDFGTVSTVRVRGRGRLGLLVSPARRLDDRELGLKVDGVAAEEPPTGRPTIDQEVLPGDVFLAINDVPLLPFPTDTCGRLFELSAQCERRKLRIFRGGEITEQEREHPAYRILRALGYPPDIRLVKVPDGRLGLVVSPARQVGPLAQDVTHDIPEGWLRVDKRIAGAELPAEVEAGDVIIRVNGLPLDDFSFSTAMRILQLATHRVLTLVKRSPSVEDIAAEEEEAPGVFAIPQAPRRRPPTQPPFGRFGRLYTPTAVGVAGARGYVTPPTPPNVRGWHLVGRQLQLGSLRDRPSFEQPLTSMGQAAA